MVDATSVTVEILVKAGSVYETKNNNWISHFLEHMFFKWWKKYTSPKMVVETIDQIWWEFNAFTGNEYAWYYVKTAPEHVFIALDVLWDMMVHASFPKDEIEKEKWVVIQEINMYDDRPDAKVMEYRERQYFGDNSYWWPIIWPEHNIITFTQSDLFAHQQSLYTKDNMIIVIAWRITEQQTIIELISQLFWWLPATSTLAKPAYDNNHPSNQWDIFSQWTHQNHIVVWWPWFGHNNSHYYAAKLLANIVWWTMSSRLFQEIREKRWLCYYIWCSHHVHPTHGTFIIRSWLSKEHYEAGITAIKDELYKIATWWISELELLQAKGNLTGKIQMGIETSDQMADFIWSQYLLYNNIKQLQDILWAYNRVLHEDINEIAHLLHPDNLYWATIA